MLAAAAACLVLGLGAGSAQSASRDQPRRDHDRGRWFEHTCTQAPDGFAACGAQVVTDSSGVPLAGGLPPSGAYGPAQFHTAYNLPAGIASPGAKTIAIVDAYDDPNIAADLAYYDSVYGLPDLNSYGSGTPWFRKVNQTGGTSYPARNTGWGLEIALDVETAHEICQNCNILLVEASSNSYANLGAAENEAVALGANVVSNSYGGSDSSSDTSYDSYYNHPGVVITASTGDSGYGVEYPASSPYVVAVGGTTLNLNSDNTYASEAAWVDGGSGCSANEKAKPSWQHDSGCPTRMVADVSADADPNTGAAVYDTYGYSGWVQVGGTSLSSPLVASVYALSGNTTNGSAPYGDPGDLHDVTSGSNGSCSTAYFCTAGPGYDGPTGLGTPNGTTAFASTSATPDFSLSSSPSSRTVAQGSGTSYAITMSPSGGFADAVNLSVSGFPTGTIGGISPSSVTGVSPAATLSLTTASTTPAGTYTLTVTGKDAGSSLTHSIPLTLVVQAAPAPDFSLSISPSSQTLRTPGSVKYTVTVNKINGFAGSVTLSASGLPTGFTSSFSPNPTSSSSTLTITAPRSSRRTITFTVTGSSGSLVHTKSATLSVR